MNMFTVGRNALVFFLCISLFSFVDAQKKGNGVVDAYSMTLEALRGPAAVDVSVTLHTSDATAFPIPASLKKLQIKLLNADGDVVFIKNAFDLPVQDDQVTASITELTGPRKLEVQAHIRTDQTKREVVLKGSVDVLMRPDLIVDRIIARATASLNMPFSIEAVIREINMQVGAKATVSLWEASTLLGSIPGVQVSAGGQVSAVFQGLTASSTGQHDYTIKITDADPAEYNTANNDSTVSVQVVGSAASMSYSMLYDRHENYNFHSWQTTDCYGSYDYTATGRDENFGFEGYVTPSVGLHAPFDRIRWDVENETGLVAHYDTTNLSAVSSTVGGDGSYRDVYVVTDTVRHISFNMRVGADVIDGLSSNYIIFQMARYVANVVYILNIDGNIVTTIVQDPDSVFINATSTVSVRIALEDDGYVAGGKATMTLQPSQHMSDGFSESYNDGCGNVSYGFSSGYDWIHGEGSGITDSTQLPSASMKSIRIPSVASEALPQEIRLDRNYPNPFNPSTTIRYQLPENQQVNISVFNIIGQLVTTLVDGEVAAGYHSVVWNAGSTPSGIYFVRMNAGPYHFTQRAILVK